MCFMPAYYLIVSIGSYYLIRRRYFQTFQSRQCRTVLCVTYNNIQGTWVHSWPQYPSVQVFMWFTISHSFEESRHIVRLGTRRKRFKNASLASDRGSHGHHSSAAIIKDQLVLCSLTHPVTTRFFNLRHTARSDIESHQACATYRNIVCSMEIKELLQRCEQICATSSVTCAATSPLRRRSLCVAKVSQDDTVTSKRPSLF